MLGLSLLTVRPMGLSGSQKSMNHNWHKPSLGNNLAVRKKRFHFLSKINEKGITETNQAPAEWPVSLDPFK
jgi:hypothetical protein